MVKSLVSDSIDEVVRQAGFRRRGSRWYRTARQLTDLVSLIKSKSGVSIDVELGVFDPVPYQELWGRLPERVTEADCMVRVTLDELSSQWRLWHQDDPTDAAELADAIRRLGLSWFESMHAPAARVEALRARPWLTPTEAALLALAEAALGDHAAARARLEQLVDSSTGPWALRIERLLKVVDQGAPTT